jgi:flagellar basal-body rod protein FlgB
MSIIKPTNFELMSKMLDYSAARQKAIANNIVNVNTPGYRRTDVEFEHELLTAVESKDEDAIANLGFKNVKPSETAIRKDGNNVDIDLEMAKLSENALTFSIYATLLRRKFQGIKQVIKGQ